MWESLGGDDAGDRLNRLRTHLENAHRIAGLGSWEADLDSGSMHSSATVRQIFGWPDDLELTLDRLLAAIHPDDRAHVAAFQERSQREGAGYSVDHRVVRPDGSVRHVHEAVVVEFDDHGRPCRLIGTIQDISDRVALTRRVLDTESRRRELLHRLVRTSEDARAQLAADLHDRPIQVLTATAMRLEHLVLTDDSVPDWTAEAVDTVRDVLGQLRDVLFELQPRSVASGVAATLDELAATVLPETQLSVHVDGGEPAPGASRALYGVVQEALWDLREQHDQPEVLHLHVATSRGIQIELRGEGAEPLLGRAGLLGVQERCEALGGGAAIDGDTGVLRCWLPEVDGP